VPASQKPSRADRPCCRLRGVGYAVSCFRLRRAHGRPRVAPARLVVVHLRVRNVRTAQRPHRMSSADGIKAPTHLLKLLAKRGSDSGLGALCSQCCKGSTDDFQSPPDSENHIAGYRDSARLLMVALRMARFAYSVGGVYVRFASIACG
jgi:hypothetical protein